MVVVHFKWVNMNSTSFGSIRIGRFFTLDSWKLDKFQMKIEIIPCEIWKLKQINIEMLQKSTND